MENINIEEYIKDLSPELQAKARACKTLDELLVLADENDIAIPDEAVEAVAGGGLKANPKEVCPKGNGKQSHDLVYKGVHTEYYVYDCRMCGERFYCLTML